MPMIFILPASISVVRFKVSYGTVRFREIIRTLLTGHHHEADTRSIHFLVVITPLAHTHNKHRLQLFGTENVVQRRFQNEFQKFKLETEKRSSIVVTHIVRVSPLQGLFRCAKKNDKTADHEDTKTSDQQ
jgi:hypothetical protein